MENTQINMSLLLAYAPELVETLRSALEWDEKSNEGPRPQWAFEAEKLIKKIENNE